MNKLIKFLHKQEKIQSYLQARKQQNHGIYLYNSSINMNYYMASLDYYYNDQTIVYVAPNPYKATQTYEHLCHLIGHEQVHLYVVDELLSAELVVTSLEFRHERMSALKSVLSQEKKIIVTHPYALLKPISSKDTMLNSVINLEVNQEIQLEKLYRNLIKLGYKRTPSTISVGDFSVRGGVIDIYPIGEKYPIRLDMFGEEIDQIKTFDPNTQMSSGSCTSITIYPLVDLLYDSDKTEQITNKIARYLHTPSNKFIQDMQDLKNYENNERLSKYIKYMGISYETFADYLIDASFIFEEYGKILDNYQQLNQDVLQFQSAHEESKQLDLLFFEELSSLMRPMHKTFLSEYKQTVTTFPTTHLIPLNSYNITDYQNNLKMFIQDLKSNNAKTILICLEDAYKQDIVIENLSIANVEYHITKDIQNTKEKAINIISMGEVLSFGWTDERLEVYTEHELFRELKLKNTKYRSAYQNTVKITSKEDLNVGDYVVHYDYGIGKYLGIKTVELNNIKNDYLKILYKDMELYIPVEKINLLEKYQGSEGSIPKLTKIATKEWEKKKEKIASKIAVMAEDLLKIQALRQEESGFTFAKDNELSIAFAGDFEYEETQDQHQAIIEVTKDMESPRIMDRLICGDVGYGKTEIAMRAAFKAVISGKQVLYLAPTTILTRQHYLNFKERFEKFGIRVELLSRLVDAKRQTDIIRDVKLGKVDVIIGTHRALSDEIEYLDLGLLIIDEEQRFGVIHKEKIKQIKQNIEVLTLSATPIPRTLQMSIMGIRSISLLETPPQDRYPIQTYVLEENESIIRDAIYRELARNGQVFFLHNRIAELDNVYRKIKRLVPEARVIVGHGQMPKEQLEDVIESFVEKEYDVFLCTTIIETGVDIPNANTLIITDADRLGLSQIYQIRGRVGRTNKVAYAYLMFKANKVLTESGMKRLNAIKEFTQLGSGYKIALRDLAIRGAGDILGKEQSGFIDDIGLEMYMKLLNEAIDKLQGKTTKSETERKVYSIDISKHVDEAYVSDDDIRILIHKEIYKVKNQEGKNKLIEEFSDRFGKLSEELLLYVERQLLDYFLNIFEVNQFVDNKHIVSCNFSPKVSAELDGFHVFNSAREISLNIYLEYKHRQMIIKYKKQENKHDWLIHLNLFFEKIQAKKKSI